MYVYDCFTVGISIPRLLVYFQWALGSQLLNQGWHFTFNVIQEQNYLKVYFPVCNCVFVIQTFAACRSCACTDRTSNPGISLSCWRMARCSVLRLLHRRPYARDSPAPPTRVNLSDTRRRMSEQINKTNYHYI